MSPLGGREHVPLLVGFAPRGGDHHHRGHGIVWYRMIACLVIVDGTVEKRARKMGTVNSTGSIAS